MNHSTHNNIISFIWGIADDVLRDVYVRGKYRDVILPMTVIRRLDVLLEPTKQAVLDRYEQVKRLNAEPNVAQFEPITKYPFYNLSQFTLRSLYNNPSQIRPNFEAYLEGFSPNVKEIISKFKFRNQLETLQEANRLYPLIEKFISPKMNLSPEPVYDAHGHLLHEGLSNLGMGYVFEELIRRFNEENNEEAGEHFTPRDIIQLMTHLLFEPVKERITSGTYLVYDDACGSGGMLTEAEKYLLQLAENVGHHPTIELYGQEVNPETYAICKADMLIKGQNADHIAFGSTLARDAFPHLKFDFMLANPPYGKSWVVDKEAIFDGKKKQVIDPRFQQGLPRVSDGQLLFLVNMLTKLKPYDPYNTQKPGSRVAMVHNGSALFTGDAGQGESDIRKWIIENDWLECIIGLPLNMFYNTGIATYIWVLSNHKPPHRQGKVQLIDARELYVKLRKNLGSKNCELTTEQIDQIVQTFLDFEDGEISRVFDNEDFGYHKITVERPLRLKTQVTMARLAQFKAENPAPRHTLADWLGEELGEAIHLDFNEVEKRIQRRIKKEGVKVTSSDLKALWGVFTETDETAQPVIKKRHSDGKVEYEPDTSLRDYEYVPLKEEIETYFEREVRPHVQDAWVDHEKTVRGYEISFTKYFYRYESLRSLEAIRADILALEAETEGLLRQIVDA